MKKYNSGKNHPKFIDLSNKIIGKLNVIEYIQYKGRGKQNRWVWKCQCECGEECFVRTTKLNSQSPQTCCKKCSDSKFHKENILPDYGSIKNRIFRRYKRGAKLRNYSFELSFEYFLDLLFKNCFYCNSEPKPYLEDKLYYNNLEPLKRNGIDRKNNKEGYTLENVVTCCNKCNTSKMDSSEEEFITWIKKVYNNIAEKSSTTIP